MDNNMGLYYNATSHLETRRYNYLAAMKLLHHKTNNRSISVKSQSRYVSAGQETKSVTVQGQVFYNLF